MTDPTALAVVPAEPMPDGKCEHDLATALDCVEEQARMRPMDLRQLYDVFKRLEALLVRESRRAA